MAGLFSGSMFAAALLLLPPTAAGQMTMKANVDAKRVGDCDGKENVQIGN